MPRKKVDVKKRILDSIGSSGATWSELYRRTEVSKGALSTHLRRLLKSGVVKREVEESTRPPTVRYVKAHSTEEGLLDAYNLPLETLRVMDPELATKLMEKYFKLNMELLTAHLLNCASSCIEDLQAKGAVDAIKSAPTPEDASTYVNLYLTKEELIYWIDWRAETLIINFVQLSSIYDDLAVPILKRLEDYYKSRYEKELDLFRKIKI